MPEILCWLLLESINYFSFDLCVCSEFAGLFLVLLSQVPLGLTILVREVSFFIGRGAFGNFSSFVNF